MQTKIFELRDRNTFIPVLAIRMMPANRLQAYYVHERSGYPRDGTAVMVTHLSGERRASADPYYWGDRTWTVAHDYITKNFETLNDGDVVDVEHILGESSTAKVSERLDRTPEY